MTTTRAEWQKKSLGTPEYLFDLFAARAAIYGVESMNEIVSLRPATVAQDAGLLGKLPRHAGC